MKKLPLFPALGLLLLSLAACRKDCFPSFFNGTDPDPIKTFRLALASGDSQAFDTLTFSYDRHGNPTSVTRPQPRSGDPNFVFLYDSLHRLVQFGGPYSDPNFAEFWHKYFYDDSNRIILDSEYFLPSLTNGQITFSAGFSAHALQYDSKGRVIYEYDTQNPADFKTYTYDSRGNLADGATYDNKVNFHRTNRVWMFIDRNFSLNNPFTASSYNHFLLPTVFVPDQIGNDNGFLYNNFYTQGWITYEH